MRKIDIYSKKRGIAGRLSNFTKRSFLFDDVACRSIEGVLQSMKFKQNGEQTIVCGLWGIQAKLAGENRDWKQDQLLYWNGNEYPRRSQAYQDLVDRLYRTVYEQDEQFRKDIKKASKYILVHSIGNPVAEDTVLTEKEFVDRLTMLGKEAAKTLRKR